MSFRPTIQLSFSILALVVTGLDNNFLCPAVLTQSCTLRFKNMCICILNTCKHIHNRYHIRMPYMGKNGYNNCTTLVDVFTSIRKFPNYQPKSSALAVCITTQCVLQPMNLSRLSALVQVMWEYSTGSQKLKCIYT